MIDWSTQNRMLWCHLGSVELKKPQPLPKKGSVFAEIFSHVQSLKIHKNTKNHSDIFRIHPFYRHWKNREFAETSQFFSIFRNSRCFSKIWHQRHWNIPYSESPTPKQLPGLSPSPGPQAALLGPPKAFAPSVKAPCWGGATASDAMNSIFVEHWGIHWLVVDLQTPHCSEYTVNILVIMVNING